MMTYDPSPTETTKENQVSFAPTDHIPGLLVAHAQTSRLPVDRCTINDCFVVGRGSSAHLSIRDPKISGNHFAIKRNRRVCVLDDLGSTNGTFVNGHPVSGTVTLPDQAVIRAGHTIFVYQSNVIPFISSPPINRFGIAGKFHTSSIIAALKQAAVSKRHVLLTGPSGVGKELAAHAICNLIGSTSNPQKLVIFNAARFASKEEAAATLFGVAPKFFSNVDARSGLIENADGGILFIDEVHNLPESTQRTLLRIIEDHQVCRIGETHTRSIDLKFVFASNGDGPSANVAHDLFARLRKVSIPPLSKRVADIPTIFNTVLTHALVNHGFDPRSVFEHLTGDHYEALCLCNYQNDNVRELIDISDRIATHLATENSIEQAVYNVFSNRFGEGIVVTRHHDVLNDDTTPTSRYEANKTLIIKTYIESERNLSATERKLKAMGIRCSRRWIGDFLAKWGEK